MKVKKLGAILACKNLGMWLATMSFTNVRNDPALFVWLFVIYVLINVPTDLYLANHLTDAAKAELKAELEEEE